LLGKKTRLPFCHVFQNPESKQSIFLPTRSGLVSTSLDPDEIKELADKLSLLNYDFQRMSQSGQTTYLEILKIVENLND